MQSWREGLQKVSLTKLQYEKLGISLVDSKTNTDLLLENQIIILEIEDESVAQYFLEEADKLGVNCRMTKIDLNKFINGDVNEYYNLAMEYFNKISIQEYQRDEFNTIIPKSISILVDHNFIPTPCIEVKLVFLQDQKEIGAYFLYINEKKEFIDEFLIIN